MLEGKALEVGVHSHMYKEGPTCMYIDTYVCICICMKTVPICNYMYMEMYACAQDRAFETRSYMCIETDRFVLCRDGPFCFVCPRMKAGRLLSL